MMHEATVVPAQPKECLELLNRRWDSHILDGPQFVLIWEDASSRGNVAEHSDRQCKEKTFQQVVAQTVLACRLQQQTQVLKLFQEGCRVQGLIIEITGDKGRKGLSTLNCAKSRVEISARVAKAKWQTRELESASLSGESEQMARVWMYGHLQVAAEQIQRGEDRGSAEGVQRSLHRGRESRVSRCGHVQRTWVDAHTQRT